MLGPKIYICSSQVMYGSTCHDGTSPRSPFCSTPSAYSGPPPGPAPGPLTIPSYDHPTALTTTSWDAPAELGARVIANNSSMIVMEKLTGARLSPDGDVRLLVKTVASEHQVRFENCRTIIFVMCDHLRILKPCT